MSIAKTNLELQTSVFVNAILQGKTQKDAYLLAFPEMANKPLSQIYVNSCQFFKKPAVQKEYQKLLTEFQEKEKVKTEWTREQAIETLRFVVDTNKRDLERINQAADEELEILQEKILQEPKNAAKLVQELIRKRKQRRATAVNNEGIIKAAAVLNQMHGYNEETVNLNGSVVFSGENELED